METLTITEGLFKDTRFPLTGAQVIIGRDVECDISLPDPSVSRQHARVDRSDTGITLIDLGSLNGCFINEKRLQGLRTLKEGDRIRIGDVNLVYMKDATVADVIPPELASQHRNRVDGLARFQTQVQHVKNWEPVMALLCKTVSQLIEDHPKVQAIIQATPGTFIAYSGAEKETLYPLPDNLLINEVLTRSKSYQIAPDECVIPFESSIMGPPRALHIVGVPLGEDDIQLAEFAVGIAGRTPALQAQEKDGLNVASRSINLEPLRAIIGKSQGIQSVIEDIQRAAPAGAPVLILGESGTGKELVARAIHGLSPRSEEPFIAVNCAGFTGDLVDSELFGHEKGAFTGANDEHEGLFEQAGTGTLFLDEVAELPMEAQAKLLRILDSGEYRRVGGKEPKTAEARIICATNKDIEKEIENEGFRMDLFYRIAGFTIIVPPLRERLTDVPILVRHYLVVHANDAKLPVPTISDTAMEQLKGYTWPGNVRELEMLIRRLVYSSGGSAIVPEEIPFAGEYKPGSGAAPGDMVSIKEMEKRHILNVLDACKGNKTKAAEVLGIARITLYEKLRSYGS